MSGGNYGFSGEAVDALYVGGESVFEESLDTPAVNGLLSGPAAPPNNATLNIAGNGTVQPRGRQSRPTPADPRSQHRRNSETLVAERVFFAPPPPSAAGVFFFGAVQFCVGQRSTLGAVAKASFETARGEGLTSQRTGRRLKPALPPI